MAQDLKHVWLLGRLVLSPSNDGNGSWCKLEVPQALANGVRKAIHEPGLSPSPGKSHITVMLSDEVEKIGANKITDVGRLFPFRIEGVKHVKPSGWDEMSQVYFMVVKSPELKKLRISYGLSPLVKGHEFHCTVAVRRRGVLAPNNSITKHAFVDASVWKPLAGAALGAGAGSLADRFRKRKGSWLQRNMGLLLGMGAGVGTGMIADRPNVSQQAKVKADSSPSTGGSSLDTIRPADDSILPDKRPMIGAEYRAATLGDPRLIAPTQEDLDAVVPSNVPGVMDFGRSVASSGYSPLGMAFSPIVASVYQGLKNPGNRLSSMGKGLAQGSHASAITAGSGLGFMGADKLQDSLGIDDSYTKLFNDTVGGNLGAKATISATDKMAPMISRLGSWFARKMPAVVKAQQAVQQAAAPIAEAVAPIAKSTLGRTAARLGGEVIEAAAYPVMTTIDTASQLPTLLDADKTRTAIEDYLKQKYADQAKYGLIPGSLRTIGRGLLSPGKTITAVGGELAGYGKDIKPGMGLNEYMQTHT